MSAAAVFYALTHRGNRGDLAFYSSLCRGARSVLELGSGYGRVLESLASTRRRVVGLERDAALRALSRRNLRALSVAKQRSVRVVQETGPSAGATSSPVCAAPPMRNSRLVV